MATQKQIDDLVKKALLNDVAPGELAKKLWWKNNSAKVEAYKKLQEIQSSPEKLAEYVSSAGITNLTNYSWWNNSPHKKQAWSLVESKQNGETPKTTQPVPSPTTKPTVPDNSGINTSPQYKPTPSPSNVPDNSGVNSTTTKPEEVDPAQRAADVDALVKQAFEEDRQGDLAQQEWWQSAPMEVRQEAFKKINEIQSSPENLADYIAKEGFTNPENYDWWSGSPYADQVNNLVAGTVGAGSTDTSGINSGVNIGDPTAGANDDPAMKDLRANFQKELEQAVNAGTITADQADLFLQTYDGWDVTETLDVAKILEKFNEIKANTLDPEFAEAVNTFTTDLKDALAVQAEKRAQELTQEELDAEASIKGAKAGLESSGLTFSGKGIEALGAKSAFAQEGEGAMPRQMANNGVFAEGLVNKTNRLLGSSSLARYKAAMQSLGRQGEDVLGSDAMSGFNAPWYQPATGVTGSFNTTYDEQQANLLTNIAGQEGQNKSNSSPFKFNL